MSSPIHSKVLSRLSLLVPSVVLMCFSLTVRAELNVEWIDADTILVTGYGGSDTNTVTNPLGSCTNCTMITPAELDAGMNRIKAKCDDISSLSDLISDVLIGNIRVANSYIDSISTFRRFGTDTGSVIATRDYFIAMTNYVYTVDNPQTQLCRANGAFANLDNGSNRPRAISYNNGIYDYAVQNVQPYLTALVGDLEYVQSNNEEVKALSLNVKSVADEFIGLPNCPCADGSGGGSGEGCAWTQDQVDALLGYVDHIDQDQHKRFTQLTSISNNVFHIDQCLDSYAKLVSNALYNDSTIVLGDDDTWTNVYFSGESENYSYNKSNILQRIELILFGMSHSTTNYTLDAISVTNQLDDTAVNNVTNQFDDFSSDSTNSFLFAKEKLEAKVNSIKVISSMFVFWGDAGSPSPFALGYVPNLDGSNGGQYIEVGSGFLGSEVPRFRMLCRYGFQLIWATTFLFLIWLFYVRLFKYVVIFLKYAFEWINEAFAS